MHSKEKSHIDLNPFAKAHTHEEKELIWAEIQSKAVRISREKADELEKAAINLQKDEK